MLPSYLGATEAQTKQGQVPDSREGFAQGKNPTEMDFGPQRGSLETLGRFGTSTPRTVLCVSLLWFRGGSCALPKKLKQV